LRCSKCGRELDAMRQMLAQYDPKIGTLCIECYNNSLIEKTKKIKEAINRFTSSGKSDTLESKGVGKNIKQEKESEL
jgi:hypothetical protein